MHFDNLETYGVLYHLYDESELSFLRKEVKSIQDNFSCASPANQELIGHIDHEYFLSDSCKKQLSDTVLPLVQSYLEKYPKFLNRGFLTEDAQIVLHHAWVNFQKKYEYNPVHNHGGIFSFVIWLKIPYTREDEDSISFTKKLHKDALTANGKFEFFYSNTLGELHSHRLPIDPSYENGILLFPSTTHHCVYPFYTSDEYRISVSGNFYFDNSC
jgi:hypothetical protein